MTHTKSCATNCTAKPQIRSSSPAAPMTAPRMKSSRSSSFPPYRVDASDLAFEPLLISGTPSRTAPAASMTEPAAESRRLVGASTTATTIRPAATNVAATNGHHHGNFGIPAALPSDDGSVRLTHDQTFSGSPASTGAQLGFEIEGFEGIAPRRQRRHNYQLQPIRTERAEVDALETLYEERAGKRLAARSVPTYRWLRRDMLALAGGIAGQPVSILDLFSDEILLGQVLVSDRFANGRTCSKSTMAHRRTEARSLATVLRPELLTALGRDPHEIIRDALRARAERRGGGYRISGGTPRAHGGPTPDKGELRAIIHSIGCGEGWVGLRDHAIARLLAVTASRVTAMLNLDGADCHLLVGNRVRLLLHQKNGRDRHEAELDHDAADALQMYVAAFNHAMQVGGRPERIRLGEPGPVWRTERGNRMPDKAFRDALRRACVAAGVPDYTPHAFRRAWATAASEVLPRWEGALGGGWRGTERFDASYVTPNRADVRRKLSGIGLKPDRQASEPTSGLHEPAQAF